MLTDDLMHTHSVDRMAQLFLLLLILVALSPSSQARSTSTSFYKATRASTEEQVNSNQQKTTTANPEFTANQGPQHGLRQTYTPPPPPPPPSPIPPWHPSNFDPVSYVTNLQDQEQTNPLYQSPTEAKEESYSKYDNEFSSRQNTPPSQPPPRLSPPNPYTTTMGNPFGAYTYKYNSNANQNQQSQYESYYSKEANGDNIPTKKTYNNPATFNKYEGRQKVMENAFVGVQHIPGQQMESANFDDEMFDPEDEEP